MFRDHCRQSREQDQDHRGDHAVEQEQGLETAEGHPAGFPDRSQQIGADDQGSSRASHRNPDVLIGLLECHRHRFVTRTRQGQQFRGIVAHVGAGSERSHEIHGPGQPEEKQLSVYID